MHLDTRSAYTATGSIQALSTRIVFVCGSLEPGRDGVGDYTRALAEALSSRSATVSIAAISDRYVTEPQRSSAGPGTISTLRLPWRAVSRDRQLEDLLSRWVIEQRPDWMSLQLVPWSFQKRGVPLDLGPALSRVAPQTRWHVMCHELWLDESSSPRHRVLGLFQRAAVRRMFHHIAPRMVHVTLDHNAALLHSIGVSSARLPLFGNVPITATPTEPTPGAARRILFFGSPPPVIERPGVLGELRQAAWASPDPLDVRVLGGADAARLAFVDELRGALLQTSSTVTDLGFLEPADVSHEMVSADVGVVRNGGHMMGKSGSLVAMLEHGLPVWAPVWRDEPIDLDFRVGQIERNLERALELARAEPRSRRGEVARRLTADLDAAGP